MPLPTTSSGFDGIFTVVDPFTRYATFIPCMSTCTAQDVAQLFMDNIVCVHGMPEKVVSDRDPRFTSAFWASFM